MEVLLSIFGSAKELDGGPLVHGSAARPRASLQPFAARQRPDAAPGLFLARGVDVLPSAGRQTDLPRPDSEGEPALATSQPRRRT